MTETGKILKVLHTIEGAFIIAQYSLFNDDSPVTNMAIDSRKVKPFFNPHIKGANRDEKRIVWACRSRTHSLTVIFFVPFIIFSFEPC